MNYERVKYYYKSGLWKDAMVRVAVKKGIITKKQYTEITGKQYE